MNADEIKLLVLLACIPGIPLTLIMLSELVEWLRKWYEWYRKFPPDDDGDV